LEEVLFISTKLFLSNLKIGSVSLADSIFLYINPNPVLFNPPKYVRNPKSEIVDSSDILKMSASFL